MNLTTKFPALYSTRNPKQLLIKINLLDRDTVERTPFFVVRYATLAKC